MADVVADMGTVTVAHANGAGRLRASGAVRVQAGAAIAVLGTGSRLEGWPARCGLVVASELWLAHEGLELERRSLASAVWLARELTHEEHDVAVGPVVTVAGPDVALAPERLVELAMAGAIAFDPACGAEALAAGGAPLAVVYAADDAGALEPIRPLAERWARACIARRVLLSAPRSFCAGVERAVDIVERAIERFGAPVYVRRQIVHNAHVVRALAERGAVFVEELDEVPDGATVVLAAHGVSPAVRHEAAGRQGLRVIDATCPLVAKVHNEARRYASRGYEIVLVGHESHEEVVGTVGEAPDRIHVVASAGDVEALDLGTDGRLAYLTQTTLATDETAQVVDALRRRFPRIEGPSADDICYATQNRQDAVRAIAAECDLVLVVGSANSSNTARLVEVARREGCRAELVEDAGQLRLTWLDGARTVGLTAGASAPEVLVEDVIEALGRLGPVEIDERRTTTETVRFTLPVQVR